jgi:hypothetical protein
MTQTLNLWIGFIIWGLSEFFSHAFFFIYKSKFDMFLFNHILSMSFCLQEYFKNYSITSNWFIETFIWITLS